jgi:hypothetical protein
VSGKSETYWRGVLMYDAQVSEDPQEPAENDSTTEEESTGKVGLLSALQRVLQELEISLQNVLTLVGTFVIPLVAYAFGAQMAVAVGIGLSIVLWFLLVKSARYARSKTTLIVVGFALSAMLIGAGFVMKVPHAGQASMEQKSQDCSSNVIGNENKVSVNCDDKNKK